MNTKSLATGSDEQLVKPADRQDAADLLEICPIYCAKCEATWLAGQLRLDAARSHPGHQTLAPALRHGGESRTLFVRTAGVCLKNGKPTSRGAIGVFFGPNSKYNMAGPLSATLPHTDQKAELRALYCAMQVVYGAFLVDRRSDLNDDRDLTPFRLVLVTDSNAAIDSICTQRPTWRRGDQGRSLVKPDGERVENSDLFLDLEGGIQMLSLLGVPVEFSCLSRGYCQEAIRLAELGLSR